MAFLLGAVRAIGTYAGLLPGAKLDTCPPLVLPNLPQKQLEQAALFAEFTKHSTEAEVDSNPILEQLFTVPHLINEKKVDQIPSDLKKLYMGSRSLQKAMNSISKVWCSLACDPTAMSSFLESQMLPKEAFKIMGPLRAWKEEPSKEPKIQFIEFILGSDYYHLIKQFIGSVVEVNLEAQLIPYLLASEYYGSVVQLFLHGNRAGNDFDIIAVMDQPCLHPCYAHQKALEILAGKKEVDLIMCTLKEGTVEWSTTGRLLTGFLLSLQGADPRLTLTYRQLDVLQGLRVEHIHQKLGRIDSVNSVTKVLMHDDPKKTWLDADTEAKAILGLSNVGGLTSAQRDVLLRAMVDVITHDLSSTILPGKGKKSEVKAETAEAKHQREQEEAAEVLRRRTSAAQALLQLLKQLAHILAIGRKVYSSNTVELVEAAVSGCSKETKLTVRKLLNHEVPDDEEGINSVLRFLCGEIEALPLPEPAPAAPDVPEAPLVEENPRVTALFATQLAANAEAVEAAEAPDPEKEAAFQSIITQILCEAAIRNLTLAQSKYDVIVKRAQTAQSKKDNAEKRPEPKRKEGEDDDAFSKRQQLRLKEIESATAQYQKLLEELVDAEAKLVQARAKAQEASASRGE
jgi:hypothetical protein